MAHYAVEYGITRHPLAFLFCSFSLFFSDIKCGSTLELKGTDEPTDPGTTPEDPDTTPEDPDTTPDQPIITPSEPTISQETPVTPSNPSSSQNAATPQTGDAAPLSMWATFTVLASSMFGVVLAKRRKQD